MKLIIRLFYRHTYSMSEIRNRNTVEGDKYRDLAICNDCLWAASLLRTAPDIYNCPACKSKNLDIVPVLIRRVTQYVSKTREDSKSNFPSKFFISKF